MTERVYLHVGAPKSGTTYLQRLLRGHQKGLADAGVLVAGESHLDLIHAAMVLRDDPRLENLGPPARGAWDRVATQIREWPGASAVLSYELLANLTADQAARALRDLAGLDVHVVITCRDLARAVPSAWQERLKFGLPTPFEDWLPVAEDVPRSEWGWRTMDPAGVAARWGRDLPGDHVHLVTVPRDGSAEELWSRFAEATDLTALGLDPREVETVPLGERVNSSLSPTATEVLRRVNTHLAPPLDTNREQSVWLRDLLAHQVLSRLEPEPIGLTQAQYDDARARYDAAVPAVLEAGYSVHGDLADLEPSRREARTPGDVDDAEVADAAAGTIVDLLLRLREQTTRAERAEAALADSGGDLSEDMWGRSRARLLGVASRPIYAENQRLHDRLDELQEQLGEHRRLQMRVAALTDVVTQLLLEQGDRDEPALRERLREYRRRSL